jgi:hypothetical protein
MHNEHSSVQVGYDDWPEWFTLDFLPANADGAAPGLLLGVAGKPLNLFAENLKKHTVVGHFESILKDEYEISTRFLTDVEKPWGFGHVLEPYQRAGPISGRFAEFKINVPQIENDAGICSYCGGKREDEHGVECLRCSGTGRETTRDWEAIDRISATFAVLGLLLDTPDTRWLDGLDPKRKQLLSLRMFFGKRNAVIGAGLSKEFSDYLRDHSEQELPQVKAATRSVYHHMFPTYWRFGGFPFKACIASHGHLTIDVPGDRCGLYTSKPRELDCHNVDGHHQQVALLSGLAALCGTVRKELYPNA